MHYCQACEHPRLMVPDRGVARCPNCGDVDPVEFGRWLRENLTSIVDTSTNSPAEVAEAVAAWVQDRITH